MAFTKLFQSILDSTIWRETNETRLVWITMLAMADKYGDVMASIPGLADRARVTVEECELALACLMAPDKYSRTKEHEGRRIEEIDGGWNLLNHGKYRKKMNEEERREYLRVKQAERRARLKQECQQSSTIVNNCTPRSTHTEAEADSTEADESLRVSAPSSPHPPNGGKKLWEADPIQLRLNSLFRRRSSTRWTDKELRAYRKIEFEEEDLSQIERFYSADIPEKDDYRRRNLETLLNNWPGEISKALKYKENGHHRNNGEGINIPIL